MSEVRIGCSGWNYGHWRDVFYPPGLPESRWLEHYAEHFETVEINASFYRLPTRKAASRWAESTPPGFVFAVKASRYLTHVKRLRNVAEGVDRLYERIEPLVAARKARPDSLATAREVPLRRRAAGGGVGSTPARAARIRVPPPEPVRSRG